MRLDLVERRRPDRNQVRVAAHHAHRLAVPADLHGVGGEQHALAVGTAGPVQQRRAFEVPAGSHQRQAVDERVGVAGPVGDTRVGSAHVRARRPGAGTPGRRQTRRSTRQTTCRNAGARSRWRSCRRGRRSPRARPRSTSGHAVPEHVALPGAPRSSARWPMPNVGPHLDADQSWLFLAQRDLVRLGQRLDRRPLLAREPDVLALVVTRRAAIGRLLGLGVLRAAGDADETGHGTPNCRLLIADCRLAITNYADMSVARAQRLREGRELGFLAAVSARRRRRSTARRRRPGRMRAAARW